MVRRLLFDGEPGLATAAAQKWAFDKYNIRLYADSSFKRNMAERAIRGKTSPPPPLLSSKSDMKKNIKKNFVFHMLCGAHRV